MTDNFQVAIDGPASAGKSTIAKILATNLQYVYVDTGAMYRAITLAAKNAGVNYDDEAGVVDLLPTIALRFEPGTPVQRVFLNDQEVTDAIRSTEITNNVNWIIKLDGNFEESNYNFDLYYKIHDTNYVGANPINKTITFSTDNKTKEENIFVFKDGDWKNFQKLTVSRK